MLWARRGGAVHATALALALALAGPERAAADEGQWTPDQIASLNFETLRARGLELAPAELWSEDGGGLLRAAVNLSGCSASFISPEGLIATNHHCAYGALQAQSTVERDLLKDGFLARERAEELEAKGRTIRVLERVEDVTEAVNRAAAAAGDDAARHRAIQRSMKELVSACEGEHARRRCQVASFYGGSVYRLMIYFELLDIRLVYAPPAAIGEYGGELDNWMWPRHTGDFTLLRAYTDSAGEPASFAGGNVPYRPARWLKVSGEGVAEGDFVAIMGYPGHTDRYLPAAEVRRRVEQVLPLNVELYGEWISILEALGERDPAVAIKVAATKKSLANRHKNARGMLDGIRRMDLVARREAEDAALRSSADAGEGEIFSTLDRLSEQLRRVHTREFLLARARSGPNLLALAVDLIRRARAQAKPDLERPWSYMERNTARLWKRQERRLRDFDVEVDASLFASALARASSLPEDQRIEAFTPWLGADGEPRRREELMERARSLFRGSALTDGAWVKARFDAPDEAALARAAETDPLLALAFALVRELEAQEELADARSGLRSRVLPRYFAALERHRGGPLYPDANGTLRFSHAQVMGYSPQEGLVATPKTSVSGQVAKHRGAPPFDLPARARAAAPAARESYWADPTLGDVPVCFLANGDTTGGNSGSPVVNGRGELVGLNFDRVWENIAGDFGYSVARSRNVIVDIRYMLWLLDRVEGADALLAELGVAALREQPARAVSPEPRAEPSASAEAAVVESRSSTAARAGCSCGAGPRGRGEGGRLGLALGLLALAWRRRRAR